jgi:hypothetical protein
LLAFWLVATQHCGLESLGLFAHHDEGVTTGCCVGTDGCATDDCRVVEEGAYRIDADGLEVSAPRVTFLASLLDWRVAVPEPDREYESRILPDKALDGPLDWVRSWQFVRRAAALAHAPDSLNA